MGRHFKKNKRKLIRFNGNINMIIEVDCLKTSHIYERQNGKCFYCGKGISKRRTGSSYSLRGQTADHFFPQSKNNKLFGNKVLCCYECNQDKGDRDPTDEEINRFIKLYNGVVYSGGLRLVDRTTINTCVNEDHIGEVTEKVDNLLYMYPARSNSPCHFNRPQFGVSNDEF